MARVLITGMSGTGKSTLLEVLAERGHLTVDTDYDGWTLADGRWDTTKMSGLLDREPDVVVAGTVDNQGDFYDRFDHVVLLTAPLGILIERVSSRTTNPYGQTADEQVEIARYVQTVEPLLRRTATIELDGQASIDELAGAVEELTDNTP
ncbi:MAG TPA: AAA family ATPase [Trebonia sp.]